jgi:hypothetical protein
MDSHRGSGLGNEAFLELEHCEFRGVPDLVTELSIPLHTQYFEVNIAPFVQDVVDVLDVDQKYVRLSHLPPDEYAHSAKRKASVPHCGIPLGKSFF